jgi:hypothetical protein
MLFVVIASYVSIPDDGPPSEHAHGRLVVAAA